MAEIPSDGTETRASNLAAKAPLYLTFAINAIAMYLLIAPLYTDGDSKIWQASGLAIFALGNWATGVLPSGLTSVSFFVLAMLFAVQPAATVFAGFQSMALWLVFGGMVIGVAVNQTGLGARLSQSLVSRISGSYLSVLAGIAAVSFLLSFLMPSSMGRIVLLMPIVLALAKQLGFTPGSNGHKALVMTLVLANFIPAGAILPSVVQPMILAGMAETLYGIKITYTDYLIMHLPVAGLARCLLLVLVVAWLWPDKTGRRPHFDKPGPIDSSEKRLLAILLFALALWFTDSLHGIAPGWVALAAGAVILIPRLSLVPEETFNEKLDYSALFYTAGILGLSAVLTGTGLADRLGQWLFEVIPFRADAVVSNYTSLTALGTVLGLAVTNPGTPAVLSPLAGDISAMTGIPLHTVLMTQVLGFSNVILPYQAAPVVVGMALGGVAIRDGMKIALLFTVLTIILIWPLNFLWWSVLGAFTQ